MRVALLLSTAPAGGLSAARGWAADGDEVTVVLLDQAAAVARSGHADADAARAALRAGVVVAAHDDALRRRGVRPDVVVDGIKTVDLDEVADLLAEGSDKAVWL